MNRYMLHFIALCMTLGLASSATADANVFSFGVIAYPETTAAGGEPPFREVLDETDDDNLAFVVANGIKASSEPCTDTLYQRRRSVLETAKNGLIVSLAASDWAECKNEQGKSTAVAKLNRLRDLFFLNEFSIGATRIPVTRQSTAAKFRAFVENARWEMGNVMFATINLPANNNHYVYEAGRNSEFEDRLVANRNWLTRVFTFAARGNANAIVLFCDGNPLSPVLGAGERRDGFVETRRQINLLAAKFPGKVLVIHRQAGKPSQSQDIEWTGNMGQLAAGTGWTKVTVNPSASTPFAIEHMTSQGPSAHAVPPRKHRSEGVALR